MNALKSIYISLMLTSGAVAMGAVPDGYYDSLEGLTGVALKKAVKTAGFKNHKAITYGDDTWEVFKTSDVRTINGTLYYWDMYSNENVAVTSGKPNSTVMNIEHSVAKSWWGGANNDAYKDCFHLNPSNSDANSRKSNYPMAEIQTGTWNNGVTFVGKPKSGQGGGSTYVYEPADEYKGDFARVFFYMFTIYDNISWTSSCNWMYDTGSDLTLKPWAYELLLKWARQDPVSQKEIDRNEAVSKKQGNRNPFIDCPELAEYIWGSKRGQAFHYDGYSDPNPDPQPDPDDPVIDPTPVPSGYWYPVTSSADLNEDDSYVIVSVNENVAMAYTQGGGNKYFNQCSQLPTVDTSTGTRRLSSVPDNVAVIRLVKSGSGWQIGVCDKEGNSKGFISSSEMKSVTLGNSASVATVTPSSSETRIVYSYGSETGYLHYNANDNGLRFTTYNSPTNQQPVALYRLEAGKNAGITPIDGSDEPQLIGIFDINGRRVNAASTDSLDHGVYIVVTNYGTRKIVR